MQKRRSMRLNGDFNYDYETMFVLFNYKIVSIVIKSKKGLFIDLNIIILSGQEFDLCISLYILP